MYVIDVSNPSLPDSCNFYGGVSNNLGTWGIGIWQNQIYLSYICAVIPFSSNWTGVKILTYNSCVTGIREQQNETSIAIYPNPVLSESTLKTNRELNNATLTVYNSCGLVQTEIKNISGNSVKFNRDKLAAGIYFFRLSEDQEIITTEKLVIAD